MPALTHFYKADNTERLTGATSAQERTDYTISWANLTGAGFAAGDDVLILVAVKTWNSSNSGNTLFTVGFGTTFAGRATEADSAARAEPQSAASGDQYLWFDRRTLVNNENIYFAGWAAANTASFNAFRCLILKLGGLTSNDFVFAEATHSSDAPNAYDTSGAGASIPQTGDWWLIACSRWLVDSTSADMLLAINDGSADISEVQSEGEDNSDERVIGTMAYKAGLSSGTTVRARYRADTASTHDAITTKIFGLRLDAFEDHAGAQTASTITHSVVDTYQEYAGFGSFALTTTGPLLIVGWPIHLSTENTKRPYGRIQIGGSDWPAADNDRLAISDNGAAARLAPLHMGYAASQSSGTLDIDLDCAEDLDVSPTYTCVVQVAIALSLTLAASAVSGVGAAATQHLGASSSGELGFQGAAAGALQSIAADADGHHSAFLGAASGTLQPLETAAVGELIFAGAAAAALQHLLAGAQGAVEVSGTAAAAMQHLSAPASGELSFQGAAAAALQHLAAVATGRAEVQGSASAALQPLEAAAVGELIFLASAAAALQHLTATASGTFTGIGAVSGAAAGALQHLIVAASGNVHPAGAAEAALQHLSASAAGLESFDGSAAGALQHFIAAAVGTESFNGAASGALQRLLAEAAGTTEVSGSAAAELRQLRALAFGQHGEVVLRRAALVSLMQRLSMNRLSWRY
jgi:hypothetical protein